MKTILCALLGLNFALSAQAAEIIKVKGDKVVIKLDSSDETPEVGSIFAVSNKQVKIYIVKGSMAGGKVVGVSRQIAQDFGSSSMPSMSFRESVNSVSKRSSSAKVRQGTYLALVGTTGAASDIKNENGSLTFGQQMGGMGQIGTSIGQAWNLQLEFSATAGQADIAITNAASAKIQSTRTEFNLVAQRYFTNSFYLTAGLGMVGTSLNVDNTVIDGTNLIVGAGYKVSLGSSSFLFIEGRYKTIQYSKISTLNPDIQDVLADQATQNNPELLLSYGFYF
ncbi:MAG: hypothetical protein JNM93_09415 [Bacteriovoracaceae bacterium]|nr:hypothetical protein [Bacteriovoracaceae bacterium]